MLTNPARANQAYPPSTAAENNINLLQNPFSGGIPASPNNDNAKQKEVIGITLERPL